MIHTLYKTTNKINSRFYIGVHSTEDEKFGTSEWKDPYVGSGNVIWDALKKYGRDSFEVEILGYFPDEKSAYEAEKNLISEIFLKENPECYNINVGGSNPPKANGTKWINNGILNKRAANIAPIEGWYLGRLFTFSEEELSKRKANRIKMNLENNPMSNNLSRIKMTETVKNQYKSGRKPHNYKGNT